MKTSSARIKFSPDKQGSFFTRKKVIGITVSCVAALILTFSLISLIPSPGRVRFSDYTFSDDSAMTTTSGWNYDLTVVESSWSITGKVISTKEYDVNASDVLSYISGYDFFMGIGIVEYNQQKYAMSYEWDTRSISVTYTDASGDFESGASMVGNIHLIARYSYILDFISIVLDGQRVALSGYLVNGQATNGARTYSWITGVEFGDTTCEVLVVTSASFA